MWIIILAVVIWLVYTNWKKNQGQNGGNALPPTSDQQKIPQQQTPPQAPQKVQCPHCGGENKEGSYFCEHCGQKL